MDFRNYQQIAKTTDQISDGSEKSIMVPLLGLAGEAGELLSEYKKHLRDGDAHKLFKERVAEELGDLLWYVSNVASKFDLDLDAIAQDNLEKCSNRWGKLHSQQQGYWFDRDFPENEQFPRQFEVNFYEELENGQVQTRAFVKGKQLGNHLTDNSWSNDGYRFHDVFHLAYAAVLGWSPVIRKHLARKRKSNARVDEVEDGARAIVTEEAISAIIFSYAKSHAYLKGTSAVDYYLLRTIKNVTAELEVSRCTIGDWEQAIFTGYSVWHQVTENQGGRIIVDLDNRSVTYCTDGLRNLALER